MDFGPTLEIRLTVRASHREREREPRDFAYSAVPFWVGSVALIFVVARIKTHDHPIGREVK